jgi:hypothetical protein
MVYRLKYPKDGGSMILRNVYEHLPECTAGHPRNSNASVRAYLQTRSEPHPVGILNQQSRSCLSSAHAQYCSSSLNTATFTLNVMIN